MCVDEMKTIGAVEMTLGLLDLSLTLILLRVPTPMEARKDLSIALIAAATTAGAGLLLVFGCRKPGYSCVRVNTVLHLPVVLLNITAFGFLVKFVPFRLREFQKSDGSWVYMEHSTTLLIGGVLIVLIVSLLLEIILSLYLLLTGSCVMLDDTSQSQVPECSATTEPLCVEMNQDSAPDQTKLGQNQDLDSLDQTKPGLQEDSSQGQTKSALNQDSTLDTQSSETAVQMSQD